LQREPDKRADSDSVCLVLVCGAQTRPKPGNRKLFLEHIFHFLDTQRKVVFPFAGVCRIRLAEMLLAKISPHSGNSRAPVAPCPVKGGFSAWLAPLSCPPSLLAPPASVLIYSECHTPVWAVCLTPPFCFGMFLANSRGRWERCVCVCEYGSWV